MKGYSIVFIIWGFVLIILSIIVFLTQDRQLTEVKCYDRFSNEIVGATCLENLPSSIGFFPLVLFPLFLGWILFLIGIVYYEAKKDRIKKELTEKYRK